MAASNIFGYNNVNTKIERKICFVKKNSNRVAIPPYSPLNLPRAMEK